MSSIQSYYALSKLVSYCMEPLLNFSAKIMLLNRGVWQLFDNHMGQILSKNDHGRDGHKI